MQQNETELEGAQTRGLSVKQEKAIDALLSGETMTQGSEFVAVDRSTVHRWLSNPTFAASLNSRRLEMRASCEARIERLQDLAIA